MKTKKIFTIFMILLTIFLIGCGEKEQPVEEVQQPEPVTCIAPEVLIGETCCLDENQNNICDSEEPQEPECIAPEVLINGECCLDENENGVCDSEEEEVNETEENETIELEAPENIHIIEMSEISFSPRTLAINIGDTVVWQHLDTFNNRTDIKHKITIQGVGKSPLLYYGDCWNYTFTESGSYHFVDPIWINTMSNSRITVSE